jgi:hypothetical protein
VLSFWEDGMEAFGSGWAMGLWRDGRVVVCVHATQGKRNEEKNWNTRRLDGMSERETKAAKKRRECEKEERQRVAYA